MIASIIERWKSANPVICHRLGIHDFDGQLPAFASESIIKRIAEINLDLEYLQGMEGESKFEQFEIDLIVSTLKTELFELSERKEYCKSPLPWIFPLALIETSYTKREFASIDDRIRLIIKFEAQVPDFIELAKETLLPSLARVKVETAIQFLGGFIGYFNDLLISFIAQTDDEDLINEWSEVNIGVVEALTNFQKILIKEYLPVSHDDFALGEDKFRILLKNTEGVNISIDKLIDIGMQDLEKNLSLMSELVKPTGKSINQFLEEIRSDHSEPDNLMTDINNSLDRIRQFIIDSEIVGLPSQEHCMVMPTPKFARGFGFAAMNSPGPFEVKEADQSYFWVTPPEPIWSDEKTNQFMGFMNRSFLEIVAIHEAYPGHFVQLLHNKQSKSEISKLMARNITMIEGWAHYCEEMIVNLGYEPFDPVKLRAGQLLGALVRNVRYIVAISMHCREMTTNTAKQLFMEKAFLSDAIAEIEANRGTIDPMYLNYTLGKLLILKLRKDYNNELGDRYTERTFHDLLLSYGSPPITALRKLMLSNPGGMDDALF